MEKKRKRDGRERHRDREESHKGKGGQEGELRQKACFFKLLFMHNFILSQLVKVPGKNY